MIMSRKNFLILFLQFFIITACSYDNSERSTKELGNNFKSDVETLSSDEFEGRAPATPGGEKAKNFIESRYEEIGLKPANGNSYRQAVPLLETESYNFSPLNIIGKDYSLTFSSPDEVVIGSYRLDEDIELTNSELIFAGYGIVAPEYEWNDYEGLDVKGKTVVVLVNDPGYGSNDASLFTGKAMTYYGRWTYKFEEAARQGAAGALIIHQTEPASYGWDVVKNSWSGTQYSVVVDNNEGRLPVEGWIHYDTADKIFREAGMNLEELISEASEPEFKAISLQATVSVSFKNRFSHSECHNIIGFIEGKDYPDETIVYMAHWDHLGKEETDTGVEIYNGAVDNATGVAALFDIAEAFMSEKEPPQRSVVFMAVTAEESGLLGSKYYSEHPLFPLEKTVGGINMDALNVYGPTNDIISIGYGFSELDDLLEEYASEQERVVKPDQNPQRGSYYRSDHFNLAKKGVPMIYAKGGNEYTGKDSAYTKMVQEDGAKRYHSTNDVITDLWNYEGIKQDIELYYLIGKDLASGNTFPNWYEGNEFKAVRDSTDNLRQR